MQAPEIAHIHAHLKDLFLRCFGEAKDAAGVIRGNRAFMAEFARLGGTPPAMEHSTRIIPARDGDPAGEWVCAAGADPARRLLWIHGGGWISGTPADYRGITETLSRETSAAVFAVEYRLAPENPFPAGLDDCMAAHEWLRDNGPEGPAPARTLWVAGDSAGANLTLALLLDLGRSGRPLPAAAATIGASTDATASGESMVSRAALDPIIAKRGVEFVARQYVQDDTPLTDPLVSPLFGELGDLPPLLMHVGEHEVLLDDTLRFAERAQAAGSPVATKVWPGMPHVFEMFCHVLPEARQSLAEIGGFLARHEG